MNAYKFLAAVNIHTGRININLEPIQPGKAIAAMLIADMELFNVCVMVSAGGTCIVGVIPSSDTAVTIKFRGYTFADSEEEAMELTNRRWQETKGVLIDSLATQN